MMKQEDLQAVEAERLVSDEAIIECLPRVQRTARWMARQAPPNVDVSDLISIGEYALITAAHSMKYVDELPFWVYARHRVRGAMMFEIWRGYKERARHRGMEFEDGSSRLDRYAEYVLPVFEGKEMKGPSSKNPRATDFIFAVIGKPAEPGSVRDKLITALIDLLPQRQKQIIKLFYFHKISLRNIGVRLGCFEKLIRQQRENGLCAIRRQVLPAHEAEQLCQAKHKCRLLTRKKEDESCDVLVQVMRRPEHVRVGIEILRALASYPGGRTRKDVALELGYKLSKEGWAPSWFSHIFSLLIKAGLVEPTHNFIQRITEDGVAELRKVELANEPVLDIVARVA